MNIQTVNPNFATTVNSVNQSNQTIFPYNTHMPELKKGQAGEAVRFLQQFLICQGYSLVFDGQFGSQTEDIVTAFQYDQNIMPDGIVGKDTWRAISETFC